MLPVKITRKISTACRYTLLNVTQYQRPEKAHANRTPGGLFFYNCRAIVAVFDPD